MIAFRSLVLLVLGMPLVAGEIPDGSVVAAGVADYRAGNARCELPVEVEVNGDNHTGIVWFGPCSFLLYHFVVFNGDPYHCDGWDTGCGGRCEIDADRTARCLALWRATGEVYTRLTLAPDGSFAFEDGPAAFYAAAGALVRSA